MKKQTKKVKKLTLDKETLAHLEKVTGGYEKYGYQQEVVDGANSDGPMICWFSDCNPCF